MARKITQKEDQNQLIESELVNKEVNFKIKPLKFKSQKQKDFFDLCRSDDTKLLICDGPAGTGKSLIAIYAALKALKSGQYERILYVRTPVDASDNGIGFLPGDYVDKTIQYMAPLEEKLSMLLDYSDIKKLYNADKIEATVNTFMRGRSIDNTIIVIDELANFSMKEILTVFSRTEENTKIIAVGDHMQSDIGLNSCLTKLMLEFCDQESKDNGVFTFSFDNEDIVRSKLTKFIVKRFEKINKMSRQNNS
jgi:phosphate starvation-inducible PhoH-like protein